MPPLLAIPAGEALLWGGAALIAGWQYYRPGGTRDQLLHAMSSNSSASSDPSPPAQASPAEQSEAAKEEAGKEAGAPTKNCEGCTEEEKKKRSARPANPDDLLDQGWEETTDPRMAANSNRRTFRNPETGETLEFDKGRPGEPGFEGQDHYHQPNPNSTGKTDKYLDGQGNPVPRGSKPSHILPDS